MAKPLKLVLIGGSPDVVGELVTAIAAECNQAVVTSRLVAGIEVHRFSVCGENQEQPWQFFALAGGADFRALYRTVLQDADGLIGLIPADLRTVVQSQIDLGPMYQSIQEAKEKGRELPFVLQYHWSIRANEARPEELDQALGINPQAVSRVFTQVGRVPQSQALRALVNKLSSVGGLA